MIKCVILDFDGTLADTAEGILRTEEAMLREMGLPKPQGGEAQMRQGIELLTMNLPELRLRLDKEISENPCIEDVDQTLVTDTVSEKLKDRMADAKIHPEIMGSDHCPVELILN